MKNWYAVFGYPQTPKIFELTYVLCRLSKNYRCFLKRYFIVLVTFIFFTLYRLNIIR
jgi:hypothetical protein